LFRLGGNRDIFSRWMLFDFDLMLEWFCWSSILLLLGMAVDSPPAPSQRCEGFFFSACPAARIYKRCFHGHNGEYNQRFKEQE